MPETTYIVLRRIVTDEPAEAWQAVDDVTATNAETAIRKAVTRDYPPTATGELSSYVAVPARSWKPVTVRAEQTVILKLEQPA